MNKDTFKRELIRMWNTLRDDRYKIYNACNGVSCSKCPLHGIGCSEPLSSYEVVEIVKKWSEQHQQKEHIDIVRKMPNERPLKKHKISQLEYDILKFNYYNNATSRFFCDDKFFMSLLKEGYFKGADERDVVNCYFLDCEVDNDYEKR